MTKNNKRVEQELVDIAVNELKSENKPITIGAISKITGYSYHQLYYYGNCKQFTKGYKTTKQSPQSKVATASKLSKPTIAIGSTVEDYIEYLKENFFFKPETYSDVMSSMVSDIISFDLEAFSRAFKILQARGEIVACTVRPGHFVAKPEVEDDDQYIVVLGEVIRHCRGMKSAESEVLQLLRNNNLNGQAVIFKAIKEVSAEIKLTTINM